MTLLTIALAMQFVSTQLVHMSASVLMDSLAMGSIVWVVTHLHYVAP